mmetsp:Transcript_61177/g.165019  ORF Transcript_61177/g.165019 Transcript_61177/m.165019 type:complete len:247 (-) Transcript_61177:372-1112(-)
MYAGRLRENFSRGTKRVPRTPKANTNLLVGVRASGTGWLLPLRRGGDCHMMPIIGVSIETRDGRNSHWMQPTAVTLFLCHRIPVVGSSTVLTSKTGLQVPPALAAMTTMPAQARRHCSSSTATCRMIFSATRVDVRLSLTAHRKNVSTLIRGSSLVSWRPMSLVMPRVRMAKPWKWSISSTTAMAGSTKRTTVPTAWTSCVSSCSRLWFLPLVACTVHIIVDVTSITADLLILVRSSTATNRRPNK